MIAGRVSTVLQVVLQQTTTTTTPESTDNTAQGFGEFLASLAPEWVQQLPGWRFVLAVLILLAGVYLSKLVVRLLGRPVAKRFARQSVAQMVLSGVRIVVILMSAFVSLGAYGATLPDIVVFGTVFSAVVGIVLAPIIGSVINGLFILADQPYEIGDMIELDTGERGFVEEITIRYTKMFTLDNTFLVLPNSSVRERDVVNYSAEDKRTRLTLNILVTYESDIETARRLIERAAQNCEDVIEGGPAIRIGSARYPAKPTCYLDSYGDHGIVLTLRYWAKQPYKMLTVRSKVQTRIKTLFEESDATLKFAYPHQHLVFDETSGTANVNVDSGRWRSLPGDGERLSNPDDPSGPNT
ncbi:mechanosensitive ion channel protein [Haloprofundus marisrubri]|uniref:Mechanosensitive ion channel protein n=1 Tax=Haloprofundus marisrubri TaxID=1514971 RepID=A0A0W1R4Y0_9EURY|nr:mechanosensitive ion channel family protein [Haloprofundus marisrubri]KTG08295.1 mechanosensitive ion channel protein [Haloprofundus marisrubri]